MWQTASNVLSVITNTYNNQDTCNYGMKQQYTDDDATQHFYSQSNEESCHDVNLPEFDPQHWSMECFEVGRYLGNGKFGHVYLVRENNTKFVLALKILSKKQLKLCQLTGSLAREIEILTHLKHPNIITFYGFFQTDKRVHLMLEWAPLGDLYGQLKKQPNRRFTEKQAGNIVRQITSAIGYMHEMNVIHRDLKPENILCFQDEIYKISDFGWSVHTPSNRRKTLCGTLDYLCPEMINYRQHDNRVDIWTIGVLAYELVTGRPPFESQNEMETKRKIQNISFQFPPYVSDIFKDFVSGVLVHDCAKRPNIIQMLKHPWLN